MVRLPGRGAMGDRNVGGEQGEGMGDRSNGGREGRVGKGEGEGKSLTYNDRILDMPLIIVSTDKLLSNS